MPYRDTGVLVSEVLEFLGDKRHAIQCIPKRALGYEQEIGAFPQHKRSCIHVGEAQKTLQQT
jgi:hypothetical protein